MALESHDQHVDLVTSLLLRLPCAGRAHSCVVLYELCRMRGSSLLNAAAGVNYGTLGTWASTNQPGARTGHSQCIELVPCLRLAVPTALWRVSLRSLLHRLQLLEYFRRLRLRRQQESRLSVRVCSVLAEDSVLQCSSRSFWWFDPPTNRFNYIGGPNTVNRTRSAPVSSLSLSLAPEPWRIPGLPAVLRVRPPWSR